MTPTPKQRILSWFAYAIFRVWNLRWYLPVLIVRDRKASLTWRVEVAAETMRRVLDDLETRGDEVTARARLYAVLTEIDWS